MYRITHRELIRTTVQKENSELGIQRVSANVSKGWIVLFGDILEQVIFEIVGIALSVAASNDVRCYSIYLCSVSRCKL